MISSRNSDNILIKQYVNGDESSFELLVFRHKDKVFAFIMSKVKNLDLANDIFQETFIKVIKSLKSGKYNEEGKFVPWVMRIAHNLIIDHFRSKKKMKTVSRNDTFNIFDIISDGDKNIEDDIITNQIFKKLKSLIEYLPSDQKEVLEMRYYRDYSFKDIAEITNVSINTSLGRMRYAIINLRKLIEKNNIELHVN
ncbi:MAG: RNA polymerase subunit sigma-24 [Flavobacteriales bacterium]|nr:RNA polymerase subunit sigma-24 [Flavobacteriales bacterium]